MKTRGREGFGTTPVSAVWCQRSAGKPASAMDNLDHSTQLKPLGFSFDTFMGKAGVNM